MTTVDTPTPKGEAVEEQEAERRPSLTHRLLFSVVARHHAGRSLPGRSAMRRLGPSATALLAREAKTASTPVPAAGIQEPMRPLRLDQMPPHYFPLTHEHLCHAVKWARYRRKSCLHYEQSAMNEMVKTLVALRNGTLIPDPRRPIEKEKFSKAIVIAATLPGGEIALRGLLNAGGDPNGEQGMPLRYAFSNELIGSSRILLRAGANPFAITKEALDMAAWTAPRNLITLIKEGWKAAEAHEGPRRVYTLTPQPS